MNLAAALLAVAAVLAPGASTEPATVTVMTRNLYLGADVGPAMELLPDFAAATAFMWSQVHQTDFPARAVGLAREVAQARPDVIAVQEATTWLCTPHVWQAAVPVYDFTADFLAATSAAGVPYVVAGDGAALNTGFSINPIPGVTMARDPAVFQPLFGTDEAACGFRIADAVLVRADLAGSVRAAGTSEYTADYTIIPTLMNVYRGYAWADLDVGGVTVRFVGTHLESLFDSDAVPVARDQAAQLAADLDGAMPTVVMGDLNSDPRDPRAPGAPNPGGQPVASTRCPAQVDGGSDDTCSAYWTMVHSGFTDAGPDAAAHPTWGYSALLTGPDAARPTGLTDRLDYVLTRGMGPVLDAHVIGGDYPAGDDVVPCGTTVCAPSDHAGLVATIAIPASGERDPAPPGHARVPFGFWKAMGVAAALGAVGAVRRRIRRSSAG